MPLIDVFATCSAKSLSQANITSCLDHCSSVLTCLLPLPSLPYGLFSMQQPKRAAKM